jgi:hypothetical protein
MTRQTDQTEDRLRPRKKGRSSKSTRRYLILGGAIGAVAVLGLVVGAVVLIWSAVGLMKATAPEHYAVYNSPEDVFHVSLPKGWKLESGGRKDMYWVSAERGFATIKVNESLVGSLLGDIAGAAQPDANVSDDRLPVSRVHEIKQRSVADEYSDYREDPAVTVETQFGKARCSAFTAREVAGRKVRGYRATALGTRTQVTVVCTCSPGDWGALEPAFARVIASVGPGTRGR